MNKEENKVAIVTGGGDGIGKSTCLALAEKGYAVVVSDIDIVKADHVTKLITDNGGLSIAVKTNVSNYNEMMSLLETSIDQYQKIDLFVNNAGIGNKHYKKTAEHDLDDWHNVISVNQTGVFYGMQLALIQMLKQGYGNIVNVASLAGIKASGNSLAYSASKFAVVGMTKSAALEYASKNIRINCVCPSYTKTKLLDEVFEQRPDLEGKFMNYMPMKRFGEANEIAQTILWLASEHASFITGQAIIIDGGSSL